MSATGGRVREPVRERQAAENLLQHLERLAQRLESTGEVIEQLRRERSGLLAAAGVGSPAALVKRIEGWLRLEEEHRVVLEERREAAERLQGLIDKVDRLQR
ncbi:MAG: hypothetical protein KAY32_04235 [Candidatus Eisenbacteria sp.]|nr:hypothetical protein [Candidatus Eisenbacteria bacterium]